MTSPRFPYLPIAVIIRGRHVSVEALLDTGFNADIVVPDYFDLGPSATTVNLTLGDGSSIRVRRAHGYVQVGDFDPIAAEVLATGNIYAIGVGILSRYEIILDHGQRVIVNP